MTESNTVGLGRRRPLGALLLILLAATGCSSLVRVAEYPLRKLAEETEPATRPLTPVALQDQLMRFADRYHSAVIAATAKLRENGRPPDPARLLLMRLRYTEDLYAVATGPNPLANLLDMVVVVSMTRMQMQDYWMPVKFGSSATTLLTILRQQEKEIWGLTQTALTPAEQNELRQALHAWHQQNRGQKTLDEMRATGFASAIAKYGSAEGSPSGSVFDLLDLDPLAALDPATQEIARTRHFGERALFLVQRMPTLLRWQAELLAMRVAGLPETRAALDDTQRLSVAADRLSRTAQQLPADVARERKLLLDALRMQSGSLSALADRVQQALHAGSEMARSTDAALNTFDRVYAELHSGPRDPKAEPFRVGDYKEMAAQVAVTAAEINRMLQSIESLAESQGTAAERRSLSHIAADLERRGDRLIERLLRVGAVLIGLACAGLLGVLLVYRLLVIRLSPRSARSAT